MQSKEKGRRKSSIKNPHLEEMKEDILYHLGLTTLNDDLQIMFGDVKFVCVGGTSERMRNFAEYVNKILDRSCTTEGELQNVSKSNRYSMFKAGSVLCVSHGIGSPSLSVVLHEVMKLMHHAGAEDPVFLRLGTCGGLGLPPGSIVITSVSVNGLLKPYQELVVLGQKVQRPSTLDEELCKELKNVADKYMPDCNVVVGKTMCADDFYEVKLRLPGQFYDHQPIANPPDYVARLQRIMNTLKQTNPVRHGLPRIYVPKELSTCTHVFIRRSPFKKSLQCPYEGPFRVIRRLTKDFVVNMKGEDKMINIDRCKPAFLLSQETVPEESAPERSAPRSYVTRYGRKVRFRLPNEV